LKRALLALVLISLPGCRPKVPVLPGLISEVAAFEGWYSPDGTQRIPFKGGREDGQAICKILLAGTACDNPKGQGRGALTLIFAGPKTQEVGLAWPQPVVTIEEQSYTVRMDDLMAILQRLAPPPPKAGS
jgi:hypothetical protein